MGAEHMTIGRLAQAAEVNVETIRYYQRLGLLPIPARGYRSIRRYGPEDLKRVRFIKRAQRLGFSLEEIELLLKLSVGEHCAETKALAQQKLRLVEEKLSDLQAMEASLKTLIQACSTGRSGCGCPIIDNLSGEA